MKNCFSEAHIYLLYLQYWLFVPEMCGGGGSVLTYSGVSGCAAPMGSILTRIPV